MPTKREVLEKVSFGKRIAEEEVDDLASYFVETNQWRQIFSGENDVVFGDKGGGKSAIYSLPETTEPEGDLDRAAPSQTCDEHDACPALIATPAQRGSRRCNRPRAGTR